MLLAPLSSLEFPSWRAPGFDPTHPAAYFSGGASFLPAQGGVYINALTGGVTAKTGTQTFGIGAIGPYVQANASGAYNSFANSFTTAPSAITIAAIVVPLASVAGGVILATNGGSGLGLQMTLRSLVLGYRNSTLYSSSLAAMSIGTPYFVASSCNGTTTYFVQANLATGQVLTASIASGVTQGSTTTWYLGQGGTSGSQQAGCNIAALMCSFNALSLPQLKAWAADPWAFWYPDDDPDYQLVGLSSGALSFAGLSRSMFRALSAFSGAQTMAGHLASSRVSSTGASAQAVAAAARSASVNEARSAPTLVASFAATSSARAPARTTASLAASFAARSKAVYAARGAQATGAFFAAAGAMKAAVGARAAASLATALSGRSAIAAKARTSPALGAFLAARSRGAAAVKGVFSAGAGLYAASGMARASLQARGAIVAAANVIVNLNLILKAPATNRSLAAPATTRLLKAISTIRNLKAPR